MELSLWEDVVVEFLGMKEEEEEEGVKNDSPKSALTDE
jgi:hypothetical protein